MRQRDPVTGYITRSLIQLGKGRHITKQSLLRGRNELDQTISFSGIQVTSDRHTEKYICDVNSTLVLPTRNGYIR